MLKVTELIIIIARLELRGLDCYLNSFSRSSELRDIYVPLGHSQLICHYVCVDKHRRQPGSFVIRTRLCVKKKKKILVHEHLAGHNLVSLGLVTRLLYTDDLVIEFQTILQNLEDVHKFGGCTGILFTTQPLSAMLAVSFSFLFLVPW